AQLPVAPIAPAPQGAIGGQGQRMVVGRRYLHQPHPGGQSHGHRHGASGGRVVAELPIPIVAPGVGEAIGVERAIGAQQQRVAASTIEQAISRQAARGRGQGPAHGRQQQQHR
nr:hypothetical protein [Tanacetum cinerariifolium]